MRRINKATTRVRACGRRKGLLALLLVLLVICSAMPVYATSEDLDIEEAGASGSVSVDESRTGTIYGEMLYEGAAVSGGTLSVYKVADLTRAASEDPSDEAGSSEEESSSGDYGFVLTAEFSESGIELDDISNSVLAQSLAEYALSQELAGTEVIIGEDGSWSISELELGLYLVMQTEAAEGYEAISPFLVSLPYYDATTRELFYEVDAQPKMETLVPIVEVEDPEPETPTVTETPTTKLPQTGQLNWPVPVMALLGVVLLIIGHRLSRKKDKFKFEESVV